MISRRALLLGSLLVACKREERCRHCGMVVDRAGPWTSELLLNDGASVFYDTPRCALTAWRTKKVSANNMRVRDYYDAKGPMRDARELRFVVGGDVHGPMGPDFVPVEPARVSKFIQDHGADRAYALDEISPEVLQK